MMNMVAIKIATENIAIEKQIAIEHVFFDFIVIDLDFCCDWNINGIYPEVMST